MKAPSPNKAAPTATKRGMFDFAPKYATKTVMTQKAMSYETTINADSELSRPNLRSSAAMFVFVIPPIIEPEKITYEVCLKNIGTVCFA